MAISEVFPNPTVVGVHFEMLFPNLFYVESKIGELQTKIMTKFPESDLLIRRQFLIADAGSKAKIEEIPNGIESEFVQKIWQFRSETGFEAQVLSNALRIHSSCHKTYDNPVSEEKFRNLIEFVVKNFLEVAPIPTINRVGLRYIDECPIPKKDNAAFQNWYKTTFPLSRFDLTDALDMNFRTTVRKGGYFLRYIESLKKKEKGFALILDFDGFAKSVAAEDYLKVTDELHTLISDEYEASIKEPLLKFMREERREESGERS